VVSGLLETFQAGPPPGTVGGFTSRAGGVSVAPWERLNLALHVGDDTDRVLANRDLLGRELGGRWLNLPQQVHGPEALLVTAVRAGGRQITRGGARGMDALVTAEPGTPIGVLVADCVPVLIVDPVHRVIAAAHAGRRGLAAGVLQNTLAVMAGAGAVPADCRAVIGPSICGRCYEVPAAMRDEVAAVVPQSAATTRQGTAALDLPAGAVALLHAAGVGGVRRIEVCTAEDDRFFSYRRDGRTGRFAGVVMLDFI
jgi:hypothetical protein